MASLPLPTLPPSCYYIHSFITSAEEDRIISEIRRLPESRWTMLTHRRLLSLPSPLTGAAHDTLIAAPMPRYLESVLTRLKAYDYFDKSTHTGPNHVLINEYKQGEGILPHVDGPCYNPITATVSLGSHTVLEIYKTNECGEREPTATWRILQEPRSLLITTGPMYATTLHGISEIKQDENLNATDIANWHQLGDQQPYGSGRAERSTRVSLTLRDVTKVAKLGGALSFIKRS